jgi:hypothetical protein
MNTHLPSSDQLRAMMTEIDGHRVSIYMPARTAGAPTRENPIRLKNLVRQAEEMLVAAGERAAEARTMLSPVLRLAGDSNFWQRLNDGAAFFLSKEGFDHYDVPSRFEETVTVGRRYHLKPMLPLYGGDGLFYVLAISLNRVRLLQGSRHSVKEFERASLPAGIAETLFFLDVERQFEFRGTVTGPRGDQRTVGPGHGPGPDDHKERIAEYFRRVDRGLRAFVGERRAPLVLAGVDYLLPIYRSACGYAWLLDEGIPGNPDGMPARELHDRAWEIVKPVFQAERDKSVAAYRQLAGTGRTARDVRDVLAAAWDGRVGTLFVALDETCWGRANEAERSVEIHESRQPDDEDLLDRGAVQALSGGATVWVVPRAEMPEDAPMAALLRF